jgi:AcrR family transcriptional regulator
MIQIVLIGIGAGAAAALLFASVASGSILATLLFYLAPLPILIAGLGWSHWAGMVAALIAALGLSAILGFYFFTAFLIGVGLPAWWLGYLTLLARPISASGAGPAGVEWYPLGRLVLWAAIIGAIIVVVAVPNFGTDKESFQTGLRSAFERAIQIQAPTNAPAPSSRQDVERLIDILVVAIPPAAAVLATLINVFNLWLAGRIVKVSGRLRRPWPDLAELQLPRFAAGLLGAAIVGYLLPDLPGILATVLAASLLMAYAIHGFAVLHAITRGMGSRGFALGGAYATVVVFGWPVLGMSLLGLADAAFNVRGRFAAKRGPPTLRT